MTATCEWKILDTGEPICDQPARYRATYDDCASCLQRCGGALVCTEHAAQIREGAGEAGLRELRLLPGVPA